MHAGLLRCMLSCFLRTEAAKQLKNCNQSFKIRETGLVLIQRQSACHGLCTGVWTCFELSKLFPPPARISKKPPHFEPWNPKQLFSVSMAEKPTPLERKPLIIKKKKKLTGKMFLNCAGVFVLALFCVLGLAPWAPCPYLFTRRRRHKFCCSPFSNDQNFFFSLSREKNCET